MKCKFPRLSIKKNFIHFAIGDSQIYSTMTIMFIDGNRNKWILLLNNEMGY